MSRKREEFLSAVPTIISKDVGYPAAGPSSNDSVEVHKYPDYNHKGGERLVLHALYHIFANLLHLDKMTARISRAIASGIGLGREGYAQHKEHQNAEEHTESISALVAEDSNQDTDKDDDLDQDLWTLDDLEHDQAPKVSPFVDAKNTDDLIKIFNNRHPVPTKKSNGQLPNPVCIPQTRPRHRTRGFVRAYAPDLQLCGVGQDTFLDFLSGFEEAIKMHQAFNAVQPIIKGTDIFIQMASGGNIVAHAASWVLHASVEAGRRAYVQYKTNEYLDHMNVDFFRPHGLYALIMCYKPTDSYFDVGDSTTVAVARRVDGGGDFSRKSGTVKSELELPDAAPLVFPELDEIPEEKRPNAAKRAMATLNDYSDRRARARFEYDYPDSKLSVQAPPEFASRYSDPTSAASSAGIVGLVSGGKITGPRYRLKQRRRRSRLEKGESVAPRSRILTEDVLYLMIVNMPSDAEIAEAKEVLLRESAM